MQLATASASTVSGSPSISSEALVQILFGETKTHAAFEAMDVVIAGHAGRCGGAAECCGRSGVGVHEALR